MLVQWYALTLKPIIFLLNKMINIINADIKSIKIYKSASENKYICTARIINPNYTNSFFIQL